MATLDQAIIRVIHKYEGKADMRQAQKDVSAIEDRTESLNAALVAAGAAFATFAKTAVSSFGEIETAMAKFASRAGFTLERFRKETEASTLAVSRATGVRAGMLFQTTQEGISQGLLAGLGVPNIKELSGLSAKLHAAGQTDARQAMRAAIVSYQYGAPSAVQGLNQIYAASQVGAGNPSDYANAFMDVAPGGSLLNIAQTETLGALALMATGAPSLEEGATWLAALYKTMAMPMKDAQNMLMDRLGLDWKVDIPNMVKEQGGLNKFARMVRDNFTGPEIFEMFGRQEAVKGLEVLTLKPGQMVELQNQIRKRAATDPIERAWADNVETWGISVERLSRSIESFMYSWGEPLAVVAKEIMRVMRWLLDALTSLNETLGGLPAILLGLTGSLVAVAASMNALSSIMRWVRAIGAGGLFGGVGGDFDGYDRRNRRNRNWNTAAEVGIGGATTAGAAWWAARGVKEGLADLGGRWFADAATEAKVKAQVGAMFGSNGARDWVFWKNLSPPGRHNPFLGEAQDFMGDGLGRYSRDGMLHKYLGKGAQGLEWLWGAASSPLGQTAVKSTIVGLIAGGTIKAFEWWYRKTAPQQSAYWNAGLRPGVQGHLAGSGALADAPHMTRTDVTQAEIDRLRHMRQQISESNRKLFKVLLEDATPQGSMVHRMIAGYLQSANEAKYEEERQLEIAKANRRLVWNRVLRAITTDDITFWERLKILIGDDPNAPEMERQMERVAKQNDWWRGLLNDLTWGYFFKPEQRGVDLQSIGTTQAWLKQHASSMGSGLSESMAWHALQQIKAVSDLPTYDARRSPHYDAREHLQRAMRANPQATFNININVENMNDASPEDVADAVRNNLNAHHAWDVIGEHFDAATY